MHEKVKETYKFMYQLIRCLRCLFATQTELVYNCKYKYRIKTSKNNKKETDSTGQTNRQDERVQMQVYKKFKTLLGSVRYRY